MRVQEGLFFRAPIPLPRGRHQLPREEVLLAQRERLMVAMTELMAEVGYDNVRVGELAARAGVSRGAFYTCYEDLAACAFAAYDRFLEVLLGRVTAALESDAPLEEYIAGVLRGYLLPLQQDPVAGRAFEVEMEAVGRGARKRRSETLEFFVGVLCTHDLARQDPRFGPLTPSAYLGLVYAVRQFASDALDRDDEPDLLALVPALTSWITRSWQR